MRFVRGLLFSRVDAVRAAWLRLGVAARLFLVGRRGVTTLEYGLIAVAVIGIVALGVGILGNAFDTMFDAVASDLKSAAKTVGKAIPTT